MSSTYNSLACYGNSMQLVFGKTNRLIRIYSIDRQSYTFSSSSMVVDSNCRYQCLNGDNQLNIYQTTITISSTFSTISIIESTCSGNIYNDWNSRTIIR